MVPDVAAFADESPGYPIVCSSGVQGCTGSGQSIAFVGGTSAATPLVAGHDRALEPAGAATRACRGPASSPPLLYTLAQHNPQAFVDVTAGHQRAVRRLVLPGPAGLRPRHRLGLAARERRRGSARVARLTQYESNTTPLIVR